MSSRSANSGIGSTVQVLDGRLTLEKRGHENFKNTTQREGLV